MIKEKLNKWDKIIKKDPEQCFTVNYIKFSMRKIDTGNKPDWVIGTVISFIKK